MNTSSLVILKNALRQRIPERLWLRPRLLRMLKKHGLAGITPNGHFSILMPRRVFPIVSAHAKLEGHYLGYPVPSMKNLSIGALPLPAKPVFAIGMAFFEIQDPNEHRRTVEDLRSVVTRH